MATKTDRLVEIIVFGVGGILLLIASINIIIVGLNTRELICDYETEIETGVSEENDIYLKWMFGKLDTAKVKLYLNTDEKITIDQSDGFKRKIEDSGWYENIEWQDYWSYKIVAEAEYNRDKLQESLGGESYEEIQKHLKTVSAGTCKE